MSSFREFRLELGISQKALADALGVTQPAISAYEASRREPTGEASRWLDAMQSAQTHPLVDLGEYRGGPYLFPAEPWTPAFRTDIELTVGIHIDWSPIRGPWTPDLHLFLYERVIAAGRPIDILAYVDPVLLLEGLRSEEVFLSRRLPSGIGAHLEALVASVDE